MSFGNSLSGGVPRAACAVAAVLVPMALFVGDSSGVARADDETTATDRTFASASGGSVSVVSTSGGSVSESAVTAGESIYNTYWDSGPSPARRWKLYWFDHDPTGAESCAGGELIDQGSVAATSEPQQNGVKTSKTVMTRPGWVAYETFYEGDLGGITPFPCGTPDQVTQVRASPTVDIAVSERDVGVKQPVRAAVSTSGFAQGPSAKVYWTLLGPFSKRPKVGTECDGPIVTMGGITQLNQERVMTRELSLKKPGWYFFRAFSRAEGPNGSTDAGCATANATFRVSATASSTTPAAPAR
jgi:hypothetical protein